MMAATNGETEVIECRHCLNREVDMVDPRVLPCTHVYCRVCLATDREKLGVVACPTCRTVFDAEVDQLPMYKSGGDKPPMYKSGGDKPPMHKSVEHKLQISGMGGDKHKCDLCSKKDNLVQAAVMYCNSCNKRYCESHKESHDDVLVDHITVTIDEYNSQADRLQTRNCTEHKDQICVLGCAVCLTVFCVHCISPTNICTSGKQHELLNISDLAAKITADVEKFRQTTKDREARLSTLYKRTYNNISQYDRATQEMVERLHVARDKQIQAILGKYNVMESELVGGRRTVQAKMMKFMEEEVGTNLTYLSNQRQTIEDGVKSKHQVDIVNAYKGTLPEMIQLALGELPKLELDNVEALVMEDESREIDVKLVTSKIYINCELPSVTPISLTPLQAVDVAYFCHSVCHHKDNIYLGPQNYTIDFIDSDYIVKSNGKLVETHSTYGTTVYQGKIYALATNKHGRCTLNVYVPSGQLITQWSRADQCQYTRPAIVSKQVIVPDNRANKLVVYSLTGQFLKYIDCPFLNADGSAACAVGESSVIITSYENSLVFKVDISYGKAIWSNNDVTHPQAAAIVGKELVAIASEKKISLLDVNTGDLVHEIEAVGLTRKAGHYIDIDVYENNLIASTYDEGSSKVIFYRLNM